MVKSLLIRADLDSMRKRLADLESGTAERTSKAADLETEVQAAIDNGTEITTERRAEIEATLAELDKANADIASLRSEIANKETELAAAEAEQRSAAEVPAAKSENQNNNTNTTRGDNAMISFRTAELANMQVAERTALVESAPVAKMLTEVRGLTGNPNLSVTVAPAVLPLLRSTVSRYSKLAEHINLQTIKGSARQRRLGSIPEAVWTEMSAKINDLAISIDGTVEVDGYKVAGYCAIDNWVLMDNDLELLDAILYALGRSIAKALDKAVLFGSGTKMPKGIVTALLADNTLAASNVTNIAANVTGTKLIAAVVAAMGACEDDYSDGEIFWACSRKTYLKLLAETVGSNTAGAVVAGMGSEMPVIGGKVECIADIPYGVIVGGYGSLYLMGEREAATISYSTDVKFLDDQTCYKGVARYDGKPSVPSAFVAVGIDGVEVATAAATVTFAADAANA